MSERAGSAERMSGARWPAQLALGALLLAVAFGLLESLPIASLRLVLHSALPLWVPLSALIVWRWGWAGLHWSRAVLYRYWVYPRLRRRAREALAERGPVPEVAVLLATYRERPEVTRRVMGSVLGELSRIEGLERPPLVVAITGSDEDDDAIRAVFAERDRAAARGDSRASDARAGDTPAVDIELVLLRGSDGKRNALAAGLERLLARGPHPDGVFVMMDGDTHLEPGALSDVLPLFRLTPEVYALTTNEHARVRGPSWFAEWLNLRHAQRHLHNCSIALSGRLLCLTGRFSVFRARALEPSFIQIVRDDHVEHWLWGRYKLLSGDDKSTWFHLLTRGRRMVYAPDAVVVTHETVASAPLVRAYHNLRRWGGNMVRNSERAIALGPRRLGLFCFWCLVDQRLSMWTTLIGPTALAFTILRGQIELAAGYALWVLCSRTLRALPAYVHGRRFSVYYAPLAIVFDWWGAAIKLWVSFFPARQFWQNRGARELDSTRRNARVLERRAVAALALVSALTVYVLGVGQLMGSLQPFGGFAFMLRRLSQSPLELATGAALSLSVALAVYVRLEGGPARGGERSFERKPA